jgi:hypothetical protein
LFFFEKKNQKTFIHPLERRPSSARPMEESFCFFSLEEEDLSP